VTLATAVAPELPPSARWLATPPTPTSVLHIGNKSAPWVRSGRCTGGMGGSGGWPARCGQLALPLWRTLDTAEITQRGICPDCAATLRSPS